MKRKLQSLDVYFHCAAKKSSGEQSLSESQEIVEIRDPVKDLPRKYALRSDLGSVWLMLNFLTFSEQAELLKELTGPASVVKFSSQNVFVYGKSFEQPRLVAFVAPTRVVYTYSKLSLEATIWPDSISVLCSRINCICGTNFNSCLLNYYRTGSDCIGWHSDDEKELGDGQTVAGVSLGVHRVMKFKPKMSTIQGVSPFSVDLHPGSLLVMEGSTQRNFLHCIPRSKKILDFRISLTFRRIGTRQGQEQG